MRSLLSQLLAVGPELAAYILTAPVLFAAPTRAAYTQTAAPSPNLDLSQLGRVAVGGSFDSISLYTYDGQNENLSSNGSQSLLTRYPDGTFQSLGLVDADAAITAMCPFVARDGTLTGVVVGGNFTSLGGVEASSIALWKPENGTGSVTALPGLSGPVRAIHCDQGTATVYVGGSFMGANSTNALSWTTGWQNLPFAGFNGPVNSIVKNSAGNIVFAGSFTGLGNATTPTTPDAQVINLGSGNITGVGSTSDETYSDPRNIICSTPESGNNWLLEDNISGYWEGSYGFGFNPTKLRLYNANVQGRGTKTWYFERLNDGGLLNFTYVDPTTGQNQSCIQACPLPENNSTAQDFHFVNPVGTSAFRIYITSHYGSGGGLSGIEMFQDDIYGYAVNAFNEPQCDGVSNSSSSVATPNSTWTISPNLNQTPSDYLTATLNETSQLSSDTNVVFRPNIRQSGNYSVTVYTPGCILDNTCTTRGRVNMTGSLTSTGTFTPTTLYQTNNYDKFDQIYFGYVDADSGSFSPSITLSPVAGQSLPLTVVASRVRFELISSTGGLNGLYEFNPNEATVDDDFSTSAINRAGSATGSGATFSSVVQYEDTTYAAGKFNGDGISNIMAITDNATALPGGGLNGEVIGTFLNGSTLYVGGLFDNTADNTATGLNGVAVYSIPSATWSAVGAGVSGGSVLEIVPLTLNISENDVQSCLAFTGNFSSVNGFSNNAAFSADGFAVWVPSVSNWLNNIPTADVALDGMLTAYTTVPDQSPLYAGMVASQGLNYSNAVELVGSGEPTIENLGINLESNSNTSTVSTRKRAEMTDSSGQNYTGVFNGIFYSDNGLNVTVLGGNFATMASNGSTVENLVFINNTVSLQTVSGTSGLDSNSTFVALAMYNTQLYAGGSVNGTVRGSEAAGLIVYDLSTSDFASPHPPALAGDNVIVHAVAPQPESAIIYVGGDFDTAGSLPCGTLCSWDTSAMQWQTVGTGLSGIIHTMTWISKTQLVLAGNLTVNGNRTFMATYDSKGATFTEYTGASTLPGPITSFSAVTTNYDEWWVAGTATNNGSAFLSKYANGAWTAAGGLDATTHIRALQIMPLTSNHASSSLIADDQSLMILGLISLGAQGNASAVLFNGTTYEPYILTNMEDGSQGSLASIFVSNPQNFMNNNDHHLALGYVVLIALAISLVILGLVVAGGFLVERHRKRREGYVPIGGARVDKSTNIARLPPETLFQNLEGKPSPPQI